MLFAPEFDERVLHDVFGIGDRLDELAGKENEAGRGFGKTNLPIFISGDILHDLPKGLSDTRRRQLAILSNFAPNFRAGAAPPAGLTRVNRSYVTGNP